MLGPGLVSVATEIAAELAGPASMLEGLASISSSSKCSMRARLVLDGAGVVEGVVDGPTAASMTKCQSDKATKTLQCSSMQHQQI